MARTVRQRPALPAPCRRTCASRPPCFRRRTGRSSVYGNPGRADSIRASIAVRSPAQLAIVEGALILSQLAMRTWHKVNAELAGPHANELGVNAPFPVRHIEMPVFGSDDHSPEAHRRSTSHGNTSISHALRGRCIRRERGMMVIGGPERIRTRHLIHCSKKPSLVPKFGIGGSKPRTPPGTRGPWTLAH